MKPFSKKLLSEIAVKFHDGTSVVEGEIKAMVGSKNFKVAVGAGPQTICRLAQNDADLALMALSASNKICTIEITDFETSSVWNVKSILGSGRVYAFDGATSKLITFKIGTAADANGEGDISEVA